MESTLEFLAARKSGRETYRNWPAEVKAQIVSETAALTAIVNGHKQSRVDELLPWNYATLSRVQGQSQKQPLVAGLQQGEFHADTSGSDIPQQ